MRIRLGEIRAIEQVSSSPKLQQYITILNQPGGEASRHVIGTACYHGSTYSQSGLSGNGLTNTTNDFCWLSYGRQDCGVDTGMFQVGCVPAVLADIVESTLRGPVFL